MNKKLLIICLIGLLSACGSKGDLFLEPQKEAQQPAEPSEVKVKDGKAGSQHITKPSPERQEPVSS